MPDSIEVDLETTSNRDASFSVGFSSTRPSIDYAATMPNITGTYSLAKVTSRFYEYSSPTVSLSLEFANYFPSRNGFAGATLSGSVGFLNKWSGVDCQKTFIDFETTRVCDLDTASLSYDGFRVDVRANDNIAGSFPRIPCFSVPQSNGFILAWNRTGASYANYTEACRLPVRVGMYMIGEIVAPTDETGVYGFDSYTGLSSSFDYCTPQTITQSNGNRHGFVFGFLLVFTVQAVRMIYGSAPPVPYFDDIGYTGCTVTP
jgi:hypothetical protein